jgi:biotin carboxyl carrier protein
MSSYQIEVNGVNYSVVLRERRGAVLRFLIDGVECQVSVNLVPQLAAFRSSASPAALPSVQPSPQVTAPSNSPELCAPIPGIVSEIKVSEGQSVQAGDVAVILEAMKMENPIKAHRSGTISKVHVVRGQDVAHGTPLVTITTGS